MKEYIILMLKGAGMGAANVIPGVSGGTIALITGIFEKLIDSIKSMDIKALKLLLKGEFKAFAQHINLGFLLAVFGGVALSIITLAKLLEFLFANYPTYIWAYFFGLILASVYFVGKTVTEINWAVILTFIIGTAVALGISFMNPATENDSVWYLMICGVVATCSMILPGLSGSFVLILMGNYQLVFIDSVNNFDMSVLIPVIIGAVLGMLAFSHLLSWIFKRFKNPTISLLTGFIMGSLSILWPWKRELFLRDDSGMIILSSGGEPVITGYERFLPSEFSTEVILAITFMILGIASIWLIEKLAQQKEATE